MLEGSSFLSRDTYDATLQQRMVDDRSSVRTLMADFHGDLIVVVAVVDSTL